MLLPLLLTLSSSAAYVLLPSYHQVPMVAPPHLYLLPHLPAFFPRAPAARAEGVESTLDPSLVYSSRPSSPSGRAGPREVPSNNRVVATPYGARNLDLCYFLGQDIFTSHVRCNPNWADGTNEGVRRYINEMTFETNKMIGVNNMRLVWKGPFVRTEGVAQSEQQDALHRDVLSVANQGCDAVVFLLFNQYSEDCSTTTSGHKFGGVSYGGMCEVPQGRGYAVVVDQGFLKDAWTGPQILAHHLLLMLTSDLPDASKHCPSQESLLFPKLDPGNQRIDQCVVDKLTRSGVSNRPCMRD